MVEYKMEVFMYQQYRVLEQTTRYFTIFSNFEKVKSKLTLVLFVVILYFHTNVYF